jgi:hypothetical protein
MSDSSQPFLESRDSFRSKTPSSMNDLDEDVLTSDSSLEAIELSSQSPCETDHSEYYQSTNGKQPENYRHVPEVDNSDSKWVMVVGGLGYIGSHTSWELLKAGYNVLIIDNLDNSHFDTFINLETLQSQHFPDPSTRPGLLVRERQRFQSLDH